MLTQQQVLDAINTGKTSNCIDGRDFSRLADFFPIEKVKLFGFEVQDKDYTPYPWTQVEILRHLADDVDFGFTKALDKRGISASMMNNVIKMWLWVLEDPLAESSDYAQYGLPLLKQVAIKYGFTNQIGDDDGDESKYAADVY